ncbi:hypothetical protein GCM10010462_04810 [Microbacterium dextranolyticum]|uniref:Integral membrane bound transporter domain-containing protein n=2 Tax=Microbacterium dextranolyticum TaxID=36806 RepID=A0A9W6HME2_9MICO|nr:hypothetical protein GCM10017591_19490 [Microbacterium dextranolyticum]
MRRPAKSAVGAGRGLALRRGALALLATAIVVGVILAVDPEPAPVMLGISLASSLSRSQFERDARGRVEALVLLPVLGLVTMGLGVLLHDVFWAGAAVYVVALVGATLVRRFGEIGRRISAIAGTPLLAVLFLPAGAGADHGPVLAIVEPLLISVLAWTVVTIVQLPVRVRGSDAQRRRLSTAASPGVAGGAAAHPSAERPGARPPARRLSATTRMAVQVGVAATAAFVVGVAGFGSHWAWVVLSTVIVAYLPRGRADAVSKGVHRFVGAAAGSLVALVPLSVAPGFEPLIVACILTAVGIGILLREVSYAVWAFGVTVALTLLERLGGQPTPLIGMRLVEIGVGVAIGLLAVCVILPIRTTDVVRARLVPVLAAVGTAGRRHSARAREGGTTHHRGAARVLIRRAPPEAVLWASDAHVIAAAAIDGPAPGAGALRRALGDARRALGTPAALGEALRRAARAS